MTKSGILLAGLALAALTAPASAQPAQPTPPPLTFSQILSPPARILVQERLRAAGDYTGQADGIWGPDSQSALERFQQRSGLQVTGQLNPATAATLRLNAAELLAAGSVPARPVPVPMGALPSTLPPASLTTLPPASLTAPETPPASAPPATPLPEAVFGPVNPAVVRSVQARLRALGLYSGYVDGTWGPISQAAIERFQRARGLPVTRQLTPATLGALGIDPASLDLPKR